MAQKACLIIQILFYVCLLRQITAIPPPDSCEPGKHLFTNCSSPCSDETYCSTYPRAACHPDYCGGCISRFFNEDGQEVHCNEEVGVYCEMRTMSLSCIHEPGATVVIRWANYGRTSPFVCLHPYGIDRLHNTSECMYPDTAVILNALCRGKTQCTAVIDNKLFKVDPCYGIYKYLQIDFECQKVATSLSGTVAVHRKLVWSATLLTTITIWVFLQ